MSVDDLRSKVDALTIAVNELKTKAVLTEQHVINHETMVRDFMVRSDQRAEIMDRRLESGFARLQKDNAEQTAIIAKWGTVRDTLVWVCMVVGGLVTAAWAVFQWAAGHFWPK